MLIQCPYCGTILNEYFTYGNDGAVYIRTETFCHECKRWMTYYRDIKNGRIIFF